jgi:hypothetical protein
MSHLSPERSNIYALGGISSVLAIGAATETHSLDNDTITFSRGPTYTTYAKPAEADDAASAATTSQSNPEQVSVSAINHSCRTESPSYRASASVSDKSYRS